MGSLLTRVRIGREDGFILLTAIIVMAGMLMIGLATLKIVDTQARQSGIERTRESAFNLAEGLLTAQAKVLQNAWPTKPPCTGNLAGCALPAGVNACTQTNAATFPRHCPSPTEVLQIFRNVDVAAGTATWSIEVRDDRTCANTPNPIYFRGTGAPNCAVGNPGGVDSTTTGCTNGTNAADICKYDHNNGSRNRRLWVRVDATVLGRTRSLVALLQLERIPVSFQGGAVTAGSVAFSNQGNKPIVDARGSLITVRCNAVPSTTLTSNVAQNGLAMTVADPNPTRFAPGMKLVIMGANPETVTVLSAIAAGSGTLLSLQPPGASRPHVAGDIVMKAPSGDGPGDPDHNPCEHWSHTSPQQLTPQYNYVENPNADTAISAATLDLIMNGGEATVLPPGQCPGNSVSAWTGQIVISQAPVGGCSMATTGNTSLNPPPLSPGLIIVVDQADGSTAPALTVPNNTTFFGLIYMVNRQNQNGRTGFQPVLRINGGAQICGGVAVDGTVNAQVEVGQASNNQSSGGPICNGQQLEGATITYDPNVFDPPGAGGAAGLVQNTWRELVAGQ